jgi:hypothetical protein
MTLSENFKDIKGNSFVTLLSAVFLMLMLRQFSPVLKERRNPVRHAK